ncbi:MAG: polymerase sigma factor, sigma-70 family [Chthoniobacteraceae bacterium]|nr:polymerase sigma factor, sigma-70 family [Chthoniobacteraceae bacterium]
MSAPDAFDVRHFSATRWSVILTATTDSPDAAAALAILCRAYWFPLYAFVRRYGLTPHDAEDATQGFFVHLLGKQVLGSVDREKGRFRTFLLASLKHFLADERDRAHAQKRGGGHCPVSLESCTAEQRYALEPLDELSPDRLFDRRWALAVIEQALARLRAEYNALGKGALFEALRPLLAAPEEARPYAELGVTLGMNEGAIKIAVHRLRQRYGIALRAQIAETVTTAAEVDAELRHLLDALGS